MRAELELVNRIRSVMGPANPVPGDTHESNQAEMAGLAERIAALRSADLVAFEQHERRRRRPRFAGRDGGRRTFTWRVVAPALSGLAVVAVVVSLTLAGGSTGRRPVPRRSVAPEATSLPRYYVTINGVPPHAAAVVHRTVGGAKPITVPIPAAVGEFASVAAVKTDRTFYIMAYSPDKGDQLQNVLYRLDVLRNGRTAELRTKIGQFLLKQGDSVDGIAVSPDGTKLAAAVEIPRGGFHPEGEIAVFSLHSGVRVTPLGAWTAPSESALASDPVWVGNKHLAFLWHDHLRASSSFAFTGRTQVRLLDIAAPGRSLRSSRILATAGSRLGFFESAFAAPGSGPIIASAYKNVPARGPRGLATVRLVALSPKTGHVIKVFAVRHIRYRSAASRDDADSFYQVFGLDASGQHALVAAPHFGVMSDGTLQPLPGGRGVVFGAGW